MQGHMKLGTKWAALTKYCSSPVPPSPPDPPSHLSLSTGRSGRRLAFKQVCPLDLALAYGGLSSMSLGDPSSEAYEWMRLLVWHGGFSAWTVRADSRRDQLVALATDGMPSVTVAQTVPSIGAVRLGSILGMASHLG